MYWLQSLLNRLCNDQKKKSRYHTFRQIIACNTLDQSQVKNIKNAFGSATAENK